MSWWTDIFMIGIAIVIVIQRRIAIVHSMSATFIKFRLREGRESIFAKYIVHVLRQSTSNSSSYSNIFGYIYKEADNEMDIKAGREGRKEVLVPIAGSHQIDKQS